MSFKAIVQAGTVYLVPGALDVPASRRGAVVPVVVLGSWEAIPAPAPAVVPPAPVVVEEPVVAAAPVVEPVVEPAPIEAPVAAVEEPVADPAPELPVVSTRSERRKSR